MAAVDPKTTADTGIQTIQNAIKKLNGMIGQPGADVDGISKQIRALVSEQTDLRFLELRALEDSPENKAAINSLNAASAALNTEAANIGKVATALNDAAKVINAAAGLVTALTPFLV
jgi:hypothetical protein